MIQDQFLSLDIFHWSRWGGRNLDSNHTLSIEEYQCYNMTNASSIKICSHLSWLRDFIKHNMHIQSKLSFKESESEPEKIKIPS